MDPSPPRQHHRDHQAPGFAIHSHQCHEDGQVNAAGSRQIAAYQRIGSRRAAPDQQRIATGEGFRNLVASHSLSARVEDW